MQEAEPVPDAALPWWRRWGWQLGLSVAASTVVVALTAGAFTDVRLEPVAVQPSVWLALSLMTCLVLVRRTPVEMRVAVVAIAAGVAAIGPVFTPEVLARGEVRDLDVTVRSSLLGDIGLSVVLTVRTGGAVTHELLRLCLAGDSAPPSDFVIEATRGGFDVSFDDLTYSVAVDGDAVTPEDDLLRRTCDYEPWAS